MDINESYDVVVVGAGESRTAPSDHMHSYLDREGAKPTPGVVTGTLLNHDLILEETAAAVAEHRKEVA